MVSTGNHVPAGGHMARSLAWGFGPLTPPADPAVSTATAGDNLDVLRAFLRHPFPCKRLGTGLDVGVLRLRQIPESFHLGSEQTLLLAVRVQVRVLSVSQFTVARTGRT